MAKPKVGEASDGRPMHFSVGALIERNGLYLLIDRKYPPYGFAGVAGHVDEGEDEEEALCREVCEESGFKIERRRLLIAEEVDWNWCHKYVGDNKDGAGVHYWFLFSCEVSGEIKQNKGETKSIGWYTAEQIQKLNLEPVWRYWFEKLGIIPKKKIEDGFRKTRTEF